MDKPRIEEMLAPFLPDEGLDRAQLDQVASHLALLVKWNAKMNLTAVRGAEEMVTRHFGESFFAAKEWLGTSGVERAIDLGSGAGFPGLPMAIYSSETKVTLIESQNKKATFLKEVARELGLKNVTVFSGRGEDFPNKAPLVTMRAVERFGRVVSVAAGLVEPGGRLGLMIGAGQREDLPSDFQWEVGKAIPGTPGRMLVTGIRK